MESATWRIVSKENPEGLLFDVYASRGSDNQITSPVKGSSIYTEMGLSVCLFSTKMQRSS